MKRTLLFGGALLAGLALAGAAAAAGRLLTVRAASELTFTAQRPGFERSVVFGDPDRGEWGAIARNQAGNSEPWHTHSHAIRLVVISGAMSLEGEGAVTAPLTAGSFAEVPPNVRHRLICRDGADCVFYATQAARYDRMLDGAASGRPGVDAEEEAHAEMLQQIWSGP